MLSGLTKPTLLCSVCLALAMPIEVSASANPIRDALSAGARPETAIARGYQSLLPLPLENALELAFATRLSVPEVLGGALSLAVDTLSGLTACFVAANNRQISSDVVSEAAYAMGIPGDVIAQALLQANGATASGQNRTGTQPGYVGSEQIGYVYVPPDAPQAVAELPDVIPPPPATEGDGRISPDSPTNLTSTGLL